MGIPPTPASRQSTHLAHGEAGIHAAGHRDYVGGLWEEVGALQLRFLLLQGLEPHHVVLDIACGALRAGVHLIPFLEAGNYLGVDKERGLIEAGLRHELPAEVRERKRPELLVDGDFAFHRLTRAPDMALAQSLFTHLPRRDIERCLRRLGDWAPARCRCFASYLPAEDEVENGEEPHDHLLWFYTPRQMREMGRAAGWEMTWIGDWGHPRGSVMVEYRPR